MADNSPSASKTLSGLARTQHIHSVVVEPAHAFRYRAVERTPHMSLCRPCPRMLFDIGSSSPHMDLGYQARLNSIVSVVEAAHVCNSSSIEPSQYPRLPCHPRTEDVRCKSCGFASPWRRTRAESLQHTAVAWEAWRCPYILWIV